MLEFLGVTEEEKGEDGTVSLLQSRTLSGSLVGFNADDEGFMKNIFQPWLACAQNPDCIAPEGANRVFNSLLF